MEPNEVAALLEREGSGIAPDEYEADVQAEGALERRVELLKPVLDACQAAWETGTEQLHCIAQKLGDGSRDVVWRSAFGRSGILEFFLKIVASGTSRRELCIQSLRIIGNCCADTDENRARLVQANYLPSIICRLQDERLLPCTVPVLFNVLVDYEPAQQEASKCHLEQALTGFLISPSVSDYAALVPYCCSILSLLLTQDSASLLADSDTVTALLSLAIQSSYREDTGDFAALMTTAASYLANEQVQSSLIMRQQIPLFINALGHASNFDIEQMDSPDSASALKQLRSSLLTALSDLTAHDSFASAYPLDSEVSKTLWKWLHSANCWLQTAACLSLGNLTRSDDPATTLVQKWNAKLPLSGIICDPTTEDAQLLHSALCFLKNLAIPSENRPLLGDLLEPRCVPRVYALDTMPQAQFAAVSLTRLLLLNCASNVRRFCAPVTSASSAPDLESTNFRSLICLFGRSDTEPIRLEAARCATAICKVLHNHPVSSVLPDWKVAVDEGSSSGKGQTDPAGCESSDCSSYESKTRGFFYKQHVVTELFSFLVNQGKWATLRSEAWFTLAVMCRCKDGRLIVNAMLDEADTITSLTEVITGQKQAAVNENGRGMSPPVEDASRGNEIYDLSVAQELALEPRQADPKQTADMTRADRENGIVLCTQLLGQCAGELSESKVDLLRRLVHDGTQQLKESRSAKGASRQ